MPLRDRSRRLDPRELGACRYGAGAALLGIFSSAGSAAAAGGGAAAGAAAGTAAAGAAGSSLAITGLGAGTVASTALASSVPIITSTGAASGLAAGGIGVGGLASTAAQVGLSGASIVSQYGQSQNQADMLEKQAEQEKEAGKLQALQNQSRIRQVLAVNRASAASRGVVGGSGSEVAADQGNLDNYLIDAGTAARNSRLRQSIYARARSDARLAGTGRAAASLFDLGNSLRGMTY